MKHWQIPSGLPETAGFNTVCLMLELCLQLLLLAHHNSLVFWDNTYRMDWVHSVLVATFLMNYRNVGCLCADSATQSRCMLYKIAISSRNTQIKMKLRLILWFLWVHLCLCLAVGDQYFLILAFKYCVLMLNSAWLTNMLCGS